jgi:hypothetical protein
VVQEPPAETKAVEDRPMIGTELVSLRSVKPKNGRYRNIWTLIGSSPDYETFGSAPPGWLAKDIQKQLAIALVWPPCFS